MVLREPMQTFIVDVVLARLVNSILSHVALMSRATVLQSVPVGNVRVVLV